MLSGECELTVLEPAGTSTQELHRGHLIVVPRGCWHANDAPNGVTMLHITPTTGNDHTWTDPRNM